MTVQDVDFILQLVSCLLELGTEISDFRFFLLSEVRVTQVELVNLGSVSVVYSHHLSTVVVLLLLHLSAPGFTVIFVLSLELSQLLSAVSMSGLHFSTVSRVVLILNSVPVGLVLLMLVQQSGHGRRVLAVQSGLFSTVDSFKGISLQVPLAFSDRMLVL